eukprot:1463374-Pleurochrysis_carterae.AAC.1
MRSAGRQRTPASTPPPTRTARRGARRGALARARRDANASRFADPSGPCQKRLLVELVSMITAVQHNFTPLAFLTCVLILS